MSPFIGFPVLVTLMLLLAACGVAESGDVVDRRADFEVERWVDGLELASGLAFLPDGSALVIEKGGFERLGEGRVRHITEDGSNEVLLTLPVCAEFERGLLGIAIDPDFASNGFVYLYRTMDPDGQCASTTAPFARRSGSAVNRVARFTWTGGTIEPASEVVLFDGISGTNAAHQGGGLAFGPDGLLYVGVGSTSQDSDPTIPSQDLSRPEGKILRMSTEPDQLIPPDNPFVGNPKAHPLVWASGFRNPFGLAIHPTSGTIVVGDVGRDNFEELNVVTAGSDYGWPRREGFEKGPLPGDARRSVDPIYVYDHSEGCRAVIAGDFLIDDRMGPDTRDRFAFTDFACGRVWLLGMKTSDTEAHLIATIAGGKSDLTIGPDGLVYVVGIDDVVWRIRPKR